MSPFDEDLEAQLLAAARRPSPARGRRRSSALILALALGVSVVVAVIAFTSLHHDTAPRTSATVPVHRTQSEGELAARRAEVLWTEYLLWERPRLADTPVARAPQSYFPYLAYTTALMEGRFWLPNLPPQAPRTFHGYKILDAPEAIAKLRKNLVDAVPAVDSLRATRLRLTWATFDTADGKRRLPAWEFHAGGLSEPLFALAISTIKPPTPPQLARTVDNPENEWSARISKNSSTITLQFIGSPAGHKPCDATYTAHAVYDDVSLAISFWITPHTVAASHNPGALQHTACSLVGYWRTATLKLPGPLGHRPLIDSRNDAPVQIIQTTRQPRR